MEYKGLYNKISPQYSPSTLGGSTQPNERKPINQNGNSNHYYSDWKSRKSMSTEEPVIKSTNKQTNNGSKFINNKVVRIALIVIIVFIAIIGLSRLFGGGSNTATSSQQEVQVKGATAETEIGKEFAFPLTDEAGEEVANFKYLISSVELRDEIVVQGQKATAVKGRGFLIINLKITNDNDQPIELNTRDYIRLSVNGDKDEWLAPDIHNDKVEVQAISTKNTRLGFPISDSDNQLILRVGEIDGEKEEIEISFDN